MLQEVALGTKSLADYTHLAGRGLVDEIRELAEGLKGKRVLITGGGTGLGRSMGARYLELGAELIIWQVFVAPSMYPATRP